VIFNFTGFIIPAIYYWISGDPVLSIVLIISVVFWFIAQKFSWTWYNTISILIGVSINAICSWLGHPALLLTFSTVSILVSWDLSEYMDFLGQASPNDPVDVMERNHLKNIFVFLFFAVIVSALSISIQIHIKFATAIILVLLSISFLLQLIQWLRSSMENRKI
jgi:hypothetical protein